MKAVILIGGPLVGTRFRPLSLEVPQALFPIAGVPLLEHHIDACASLSDVKEILLIGFYQQTKEMARFILDMQKKHNLSIRYLQEYCPLGTGGGIYHFRDQILRGKPRAFFVLHSDICCTFPIVEMEEFHRTANGGFVILGSQANESQSLNYGCIAEDPQTHKVLHYVEKPGTFVSSTVNAGAYLFTPDIFDYLGKVFISNHKNELIPEYARDCIDLERSVLIPLAQAGKLYVYKMTSGFWCQVKTAGAAIYANRLYLSLIHQREPHLLASNGGDPDAPHIIGHVRIHPTANIDPTCTLGPNVYIGPGVTVAAGARVKEAIILDRAEIQEHSCVLHSIIGWDCILGAWSRVEGYPCDPNPNDPLANVSSESLFNEEGRLNPSITILGQGVSVNSEKMVLNSIVLSHKDLSNSYKNQIIL